MKRAALYARVSTMGQKEEATIESQLDEVRLRIKADGNQLDETHLYNDNAYTGELLARPELDRLLANAKQRAFDVLYVYDRGRLARRYAYQEIVIEELENLSIEFVTLHDIPADTDEGRVMQMMQGVFHEYERMKIGERFRRGKLHKVRSGKLLGYNPKYGYDYHPVVKQQGEKINGYFTIDEAEADVVRRVFDWFVNERLSIRGIRLRLFELGIPPKKGRQPIWTTGPLVRLLRDESYTGTHYYNKSEAIMTKHPKVGASKYRRVKKGSKRLRPKEEWLPVQIPAIITRDLYERAQERFIENQKFASRNTKHPYLLQGVIFCPCGERRTGEAVSGKQRYYRCTDRIHRYPLPPQCRQGGVNGVVLDTIVWNALVDLLTDPSTLESQAEQWLEKQNKPQFDPSISKRITDQLNRLAEEEGRYMLAYGESVLSLEQYREQQTRIAGRRTELKSQITTLDRPSSSPTATKEELISLAQTAISRLDFTDKQALVRELLDKVIADQQVVEVFGHIPVPARKVELYATDRYCRSPQCWQINAIQCSHQETSG
ncbi:recombinase family protein [Candidatus Berkelbacteria bacterium]|nr:recombinase family protein [Candidatus Berkelbacteria bacterium]